MRTNAIEIVTGSGGAVHTNNIAYAYDALNRLVGEAAKDRGDGSGYKASYVYDLVGNRLSRALTTAGKTLTTSYSYDANDRLLMESNVVSTAAPGSGMIRPQILGPNGQLLPAPDPQFAKVSYYTLKAIPYGLLAAFLLPAAMTLLRRKRPALLTLDLNPSRALLPRCVAGLLAALMLLMGFDLRVMANQAVYYAALTTDTWGLNGSVTTYQYDANGSVTQKVTTGPKPETDTFQYTLLKQLAVSTRTYASGGNQVVETATNTYNYDGIRVSSVSATAVNGVLQSSATNYFLIDPFNLTGFAQVIEESPAIGAAPTVSYTIGNDIIAQSSDPSGAAQYLLKDGHDSTRQLASSSGTVTDYYGYDAYGVMLGGNPTASSPSATKMLYSGEQFDSTLGLYNMRARFYDPGTGRFTTMDTYEGSPQDPQSLHKYTYCTDNPINYKDPTGHDTLAEVLTVVFIIGILAAIGTSVGFAIFNSGSFPDAAMVGASLSISGLAPGISALNLLLQGIFQGQSSLGTFVAGNLASAVNLGAVSLASDLGRYAGASANIGVERLYTTKDNVISNWTYYGPGVYISTAGSSLSATVTIYAGVCWHVVDDSGGPAWKAYSGGFYSFSFGAGAGPYGWAISWFMSEGDARQNGFNVGLTASVGFASSSTAPASAGEGFSYIYYTGNYGSSWDSTIILGALVVVPGVGIPWSFVLGYKWANHSG